MMSKQEKIVCAGAKVKFIKHFRGKPNNENITKEVIFPMISRNHEDHIVQIDTMLELSGGEDSDRFSKMSTQYGFITNKNRFVDAEEALKITGWGNQLRFKDRKYLLSEDLY